MTKRAALSILGLFLVTGDAAAEPPPLEVLAVAASGSMPKGASLSPDGTRFYVTSFGMENGDNVDVYDASTLLRTGTIHLPGIAVESVVSPDGATLYVSNFARHSVQFVDLRTRRVTKEIAVGRRPKVLVLDRAGRTLFVANWNGHSVTQIDVEKQRVVRTLATGRHPRGMALTSDGTLFVASFDDAAIDVFKGEDLGVHYRLAVCAIPRHLALSPDERTLYISCFHDSAVHALDVEHERIVHTIDVGRNPKSLEASRDGRYVYSADYGPSNSVSVIDTADWTSRVFTVPGMHQGSGIAVTADGAHALVTGWGDAHVYLVGFAP